ncbi:MAG TPA: pyruvate dehydrogenase complex dihydrolipoamide acetyltransferase [Parachlamydiaceae bacterium]|nr:pyruvate dehydrogenase complex dihydrolipoamide acetyltransferase [Parachlamydiaceae bacterium]
MPFTLTMPKLSPTMEEGTIAKWHKKVGEFIEADELLLEVSTDKATVEYNALDSGWVRKILIGDGQEAMVNQPIAIMTEEKTESIDNYNPVGAAAKGAEIAEVAEEKSKTADKTEAAPAKAAAAAPAMKQASFTPEAPLENVPFWRPTGDNPRIKASPLAKKLAKDKGLDLTTIKGTGPGNRIVGSDLGKAQATGLVVFGRNEQPTEAPGSYVEEALTPMRKVISQRLQEAKSYIPHFYVSLKINPHAMMDVRDQLKSGGIKVTFNDLIVRASALALRKHPNVNSGFNTVTNSIVRFKTIDISIAVSLPAGLITPIVRHADFKNVGELSMEVKELAGRAKEGKLEPHEYKGGSFTISNLGMYGVSDFIAIINPPQAAILAVSGILPVPVVKDGQIVAGHEMTLTLSGDHRVIDGVSGAEFLKTLQGLLENPAVLLV